MEQTPVVGLRYEKRPVITPRVHYTCGQTSRQPPPFISAAPCIRQCLLRRIQKYPQSDALTNSTLADSRPLERAKFTEFYTSPTSV
eukprot:scaffold522535_cov19-Prasinocladus_malaysianus.AAC.1